MKLRWLIGLLCVLMIGAVSTQAQSDNLLVNPSFDSEVYTPVSFDATNPAVYLAVPEGWYGGVIQSPRSYSWQNVHPTGLPHIGWIKVDGYRSYHVARGGGTFTAYIFQQVNVTPGTAVSAGAWAFIESNTGIARVGLDPTGGTNPYAATVQYAETAARYNWSTPTVTATAQNSVVTIFLFATQDQPTDPNGVYWDAAFVRGTAGTAPDAGQPAQSSGTPSLRATVGRLNVRVSNNSNARILGVITSASSYPVIEERGGWYRIQFEGQEGWVYGRYASVSDSPASSGGAGSNFAQSYTVQAYLRVRSVPIMGADVVANIPYGATVQIVGRTADNDWLQVRYGDVVGWSANGYGQVNGDLGQVPITG